MENNQSQNEYIVEYFDFPEIDKAETLGQLFQTAQTRKKYTTPIIHKMFSLLEYAGVDQVRYDDSTGYSIHYIDNEYTRLLEKQVGTRYLMTLTTELLSIMKLMNIKGFTRNLDNKSVKDLFEKTDSALLNHLKASLKQ